MTAEPGRAAFLRFRELERQLRESLAVEPDGDHGWGHVRTTLGLVYSGELLPGQDALKNLTRPFDEMAVFERSYRRAGRLAQEFGGGLGLPPGSWADGPAAGWSAAVAETAPAWRARADDRPRDRPPADVPRPAGWTYVTSLSNAVHFLTPALEAEPDGELLVVLLDACLVPLHTRVALPPDLSLEPLERGLAAAPRGEATLREVERFRSALARGFGAEPGAWESGSVPGWDEGIAEQAPRWLSDAAHRRVLVERREGALDLPPVPTLLDAPGWQAAGRLRELEQAVRDVLSAEDAAEERELDAWLRPVYAGSAVPGRGLPPLALRASQAAVPAALLVEAVRDGLGLGADAWQEAPPAGWTDAFVAVAPAWLEGVERRAAPVRGRLRTWFSRT